MEFQQLKNFNLGEVDIEFIASNDNNLAGASERMLNFEPMPTGSMRKRRGLQLYAKGSYIKKEFFACINTKFLGFKYFFFDPTLNAFRFNAPDEDVADPTSDSTPTLDSTWTDVSDPGCTAGTSIPVYMYSTDDLGSAGMYSDTTAAVASGYRLFLRVNVQWGTVRLIVQNAVTYSGRPTDWILTSGEHVLMLKGIGSSPRIVIKNTSRFNVAYVDDVSFTSKLNFTHISGLGTTIGQHTQIGNRLFYYDYSNQLMQLYMHDDGMSLSKHLSYAGPWADLNQTNIALKITWSAPNWVVDASDGVFTAADVGGLLRIFNDNHRSVVYLYKPNSTTGSLEITGRGTDRNIDVTLPVIDSGTSAILERSFDQSNWAIVRTDVTPVSYTYNDGFDGVIAYYRIRKVEDNNLSTSTKILVGIEAKDTTSFICIVRQYITTTQVVVEPLTEPGYYESGNAKQWSFDWQFGGFSGAAFKPLMITPFQGRVWLSNGHTVIGSAAGDFYNFDTESDAIERVIDTSTRGIVRWLASAGNQLIVGSENTVSGVKSPDSGYLTKESVIIEEYNAPGCNYFPPVPVENGLVYVGKHNTAVYMLASTPQLGVSIQKLNKYHPNILQNVWGTNTNKSETWQLYNDVRVIAVREPELRLYFSARTQSTPGNVVCCLLDLPNEKLGWYRFKFEGDGFSGFQEMDSLADRLYVTGQATDNHICLFPGKDEQYDEVDFYLHTNATGTFYPEYVHKNQTLVSYWPDDGRFGNEFYNTSNPGTPLNMVAQNAACGNQYTATWKSSIFWLPRLKLSIKRFAVFMLKFMRRDFTANGGSMPTYEPSGDITLDNDHRLPIYTESDIVINGKYDTDNQLSVSAKHPVTVCVIELGVD